MPLDDDVPSPCVSLCKLTPDRSHCLGCLRTLDEIRAWRSLDADGKRAVLAALAGRRGAH